jgi:hypothetical protein
MLQPIPASTTCRHPEIDPYLMQILMAATDFQRLMKILSQMSLHEVLMAASEAGILAHRPLA